MEYYPVLQVAGVFLLLSVITSIVAQEGTGSVVARDTDKASPLRAKLNRLSNLLSALDDVDEYDLLTVAEQKNKDKIPAKSAVASEDMGSIKDQPAVKTTLVPKISSGDKKYSQLPSDDNSLQILAKALARLREPKFNNGDSTGDYLGTENNDDEKTRDMEDMITRALTRLSQDRSGDTHDKPFYSDSNPKVVHDLEGQGHHSRSEAVQAVEAQLMQDITKANKEGISVDDIIHDLDDKVSREAQLKRIEEELNALSEQK